MKSNELLHTMARIASHYDALHCELNEFTGASIQLAESEFLKCFNSFEGCITSNNNYKIYVIRENILIFAVNEVPNEH